MSTVFLTGSLTFNSFIPPDLSRCTKTELRAYFENTYDIYESLFISLKDPSAIYKCPDRLRLPLVFYYTHTAVVYVNKLMLSGLIKGRINFEFEKMFETGVDEMSWDDTENYRMGGSYKWPDVADIVEYRRKVRHMVYDVIDKTPLQLPIDVDSPWWSLMMGMEHERIHLETSSVLIRQLPRDMLVKPKGWKYAPFKSASGPAPKQNKMLRVEKTNVTFGKPKDFPSYGWDNEYGEINRSVPPFEASEYLVSNQEYIEFIHAGGYNNRHYWTEEGWKWRTFRQAKHPMFWICDNGCKGGCGGDLSSVSHCRFPGKTDVTNGNAITSDKLHGNGNVQYKYRAIFDVLDMPWSWPVDVNYHEAKAFCKWKGEDYRLPVEAEHNVIRGQQAPSSDGTSSDVIFQKKTCHNHNMKYGSSTPVNMYAANEMGFYDVFGNVWQWMEDQFNGLCTETHWLYDDFSAPCYDGKHNLILGGSWISTGDEASRFARFAFRRHFLQHAGFRVARTVMENKDKVALPARMVDTEVFVLGSGVAENNVYLDQDKIDPEFVPSTNIQYRFENVTALKGILEQEFGFRKSFPVAVSELCKRLVDNNGLDTKSAVWIGAGTGRGPFAMSSCFKQILAIDVVGRFLDVAIRLQQGNDVDFETSKGKKMVAKLPPNSNTDSIDFKQFTWIPNEIGDDHSLTVVTFLERALHPKAWLLRLGEITSVDGLVVIASQSGAFDRDTLQPTLNSKGMECAEVISMPFESNEGIQNAVVTIWKHSNIISQSD